MSPLLQRIDILARERGLDKELVFTHLEKAMAQAAAKRFEATGEFTVTIDRETGEMRAFEDDQPVKIEDMGRIVANVAKQVFVQGLRESERDIVFNEMEPRHRTIVSGTVSREERGMVIVTMGRAEAILPKEEQIPGETYRTGAVVRALALKVEKKGQRVRIVLSRTHGDFVKELFKQEIPEIADGLIEIKGIVREPGRRTKIAVATSDPRIDPVGSCVGVRGSRITKVTDELGGEKIDIIPWAEESASFIENSLKPARILRISYDQFRDRARVIVGQDQLPLAIGKAGQNVRLAARLTRYKIDVMSEENAAKARAAGGEQLQRLIDAGLMDDFQRETFLDNHIDSLAVLAAQEAEHVVEALAEEATLELPAVVKMIAAANELLNDAERQERDEIVQRREEAAKRAEKEAEREAELEAKTAIEEAQRQVNLVSSASLDSGVSR
jgi:N utilization substance protein A